MQRRKFLATVGGLAAGSAAAIGTGAISSVTAERTVAVNLTGDSAAYLGLATPNDDVGFAPTNNVGAFEKGGNDDIIKFRLTGSNGTVRGDGVNPAALTNVLGLIGIQNQGTQAVEVYIEKSNSGRGMVPDRVGVFAAKGTTTGQPSHIAEGNEISEAGNPITLEPGENAVISLQIDTQKESKSSSVTKAVAGGDFNKEGPIDSDLWSILGEMTFHANGGEYLD